MPAQRKEEQAAKRRKLSVEDDESEEEEESEEEDEEEAAEESEEEEGDSEIDVNLHPVTTEGRHRILVGVVQQHSLQKRPFGVGAWEDCVATSSSLELLKTQCRRIKARTVGVAGKKAAKYSSGSTFWIGAGDAPRNALERVAQEVYRFHTRVNAELDDAAVDAGISGAEFWAVVCSPGDDVAPHWDKDYGLEEGSNINMHPLLASILYLTGAAYHAPTVITGVPEPYVPGFSHRPGAAAAAAAAAGGVRLKTGCAVSYPKAGKHITFDGQLLHFASSALALEAPAGGEDRIALLVNVWVNFKPQLCDPMPEGMVAALAAEEDAGAAKKKGKKGNGAILSLPREDGSKLGTSTTAKIHNVQDLLKASSEPLEKTRLQVKGPKGDAVQYAFGGRFFARKSLPAEVSTLLYEAPEFLYTERGRAPVDPADFDPEALSAEPGAFLTAEFGGREAVVAA